jgi:hypothetical protein
MRIIIVMFVFMSFGAQLFAVDVAPPAPVAAVSPAPVAPVESQIAQASEPTPTMVKDENAAPPAWIQDVFVSIKKLPVIGPIAVKVLNWVAVLCSVLTALAAFLMIALRALSSVVSLTELTDLSAKIEKFQHGKFMYYLKYASMFNAKKPAPKPVDDATPVMA